MLTLARGTTVKASTQVAACPVDGVEQAWRDHLEWFSAWNGRRWIVFVDRVEAGPRLMVSCAETVAPDV